MSSEDKPVIEQENFSDLEEDFDENEVVVEQAETVTFTQTPTAVKTNSGTSMSSLIKLTKSSDDIVTNYDDLDLEFETFSGSLDDNIEKKKIPVAISSPVVDNGEEFNFVSPKLSSNNMINLSATAVSSSNNIHNDSTMDTTTSTMNTSVDGEEMKLNVLKTRDLNISPKPYIRKPSNFKAVKVSNQSPPPENEVKIKELTKICAKYDHKIKKIKEEIEYLDYLNANTPSLKEIAKLKRAKDLLMERLEGVRKEKYNKTVKLNHLIFNSPDMHGGEYWSRTVS